LHAVPFLQGRIDRRSLNTKAMRLWTIGMAWQQRKDCWLLLTEDGVIGTQVSIGYALTLGERQKVWLMRTIGKDKWLVGIGASQCQLQLSLDKFSASKIKRTSIDLCLNIAY